MQSDLAYLGFLALCSTAASGNLTYKGAVVRSPLNLPFLPAFSSVVTHWFGFFDPQIGVFTMDMPWGVMGPDPLLSLLQLSDTLTHLVAIRLGGLSRSASIQIELQRKQLSLPTAIDL